MKIRSSVGAVAPVTDDIFSNKIGQWAFTTPFPSVKDSVNEAIGRFGIAPPDAMALDYLEDRLAPAYDLPYGHMYDDALRKAVQACQDHPLVHAVLVKDLQIREYYMGRKMEQVLS